MADLTPLAHRLNMLYDERNSIAVLLLNGTRTLTNTQVHLLKARYSEVARAIQRLEKRLQ